MSKSPVFLRIVAPLGGAGILAAAGLLVLFNPTASSATVTPPAALLVEGNAVKLDRQAPQWRYVEVRPAALSEALAPLASPGRVAVDPTRTSAVGAPLAGRVDQVLVRVGDRVKSGSRLFSVRSGDFAGLGNEVEAAKARLDAQQRVVERTRELVKLQSAPERELLTAEAELRASELALEAARTRRQSLQVGPGEASNLFWVTAPRDGTVVESDVYQDEQVSPDRDTPLLRIADLREVLVFASVQEREVADLTPGGLVSIGGAGRTETAGRIEYVSDVVDPQRRTVEVRVRASNADRTLRPNAFVDVTPRVAGGRQHVRVPSEAVVTDGDTAVVFLAKADGRFERLPVNTGRERDGEVEVLGGLTPGDLYVARGALLLLNAIDLTR